MSSSTATFDGLPIRIAQTLGLVAPTIYSSLTFAYSHMVVPPIVTHAPPKLLARQWLQAYQFAASFVPPLIVSGTISNALLAYYSPSTHLRVVYGTSAALIWSIIPVTIGYFEPRVNGAGKWKVEQLLRDEGHCMEEKKGIMPTPFVHTARPQDRQWAETVEMKEIAERWATLNAARYAATGLAVVLSAIATCCW